MSDDMRVPARRVGSDVARGVCSARHAAITALYAPEVRFQPHPFRAPLPVATYLDEVFADEVTAEPFFDQPIVDGRRAAVHWRARTELRSGKREELSGVSVLVFDDAGLVGEQRDFWADGAAD
jgi:hypothetical protein